MLSEALGGLPQVREVAQTAAALTRNLNAGAALRPGIAGRLAPLGALGVAFVAVARAARFRRLRIVFARNARGPRAARDQRQRRRRLYRVDSPAAPPSSPRRVCISAEVGTTPPRGSYSKRSFCLRATVRLEPRAQSTRSNSTMNSFEHLPATVLAPDSDANS